MAPVVAGVRLISAAGGAGATAEQVRIEMDNNSTKLAAILEDTAEIGAAGAGLTTLATQASVNDKPTLVQMEASTFLAKEATVLTRSTYAGGAVASVTGAVGSVTSPVTAGTVSDKTGYSLTTPPLNAGETQAAAEAAILARLPTNPLLADDARLDFLDAPVSEAIVVYGILSATYNAEKRPLVVTLANGKVLTHSYDGDGNLSGIEVS